MPRVDMMMLSLDEIDVPQGRRPIDAEAVKRLASSIREIGLRHPISVRSVDSRFQLIAGRHRIEAVRLNHGESIAAIIVKDDDLEARLWEIAENLHRADLTVTQRAEQITEWTKLTKEKREREREVFLRQHGAKQDAGRPEGGARMAARELGVTEQEVRRAEKIAAIAPEAKAAAREAGLDDNQRRLLEVAALPVSEQVAAVHALAEAKARKPVPPSDAPRNDFEMINLEHKALVTAWERARTEARQKFLADIGAVLADAPIMDRQFA